MYGTNETKGAGAEAKRGKSRRAKRLARAIVPVVLVGLLAPAAAAGSSTKVHLAGPTSQKLIVQSAALRETKATDWTPVPDGLHWVGLAPGKSAIITARFTGSSACWEEGGEGENSRCDVRILINNQPADPFNWVPGFDGTHGQAQPVLESHTTEGVKCLTNTSDKYGLQVFVQVNWRVVSAHADGDVPRFALASSMLTIERHDTASCG